MVIDCGINFIADATTKSGQRLVGDVDFEAVKQTASFITPVPGGEMLCFFSAYYVLIIVLIHHHRYQSR